MDHSFIAASLPSKMTRLNDGNYFRMYGKCSGSNIFLNRSCAIRVLARIRVDFGREFRRDFRRTGFGKRDRRVPHIFGTWSFCNQCVAEIDCSEGPQASAATLYRQGAVLVPVAVGNEALLYLPHARFAILTSQT